MRKMKTKQLVLVSVLIVSVAMIAVPVAAVGSIANITGNPEDFISINEAGDIANWVFIQDYLNVNTTSCSLNVTSNHIGWTVGVLDADTIKPNPGYMVDWNGVTYGTQHLNNAMVMDGVTVGGQYTAQPQTLDDTRKIIWTGVNIYPGGIGTWPAIPITIQQQVDHTDQHLLNSDVYRIVVTFSAGLP